MENSGFQPICTVMASVTPVPAGASDLFQSDTTPASHSAAASHALENSHESESADDTVELSQQALQLLETNRLFAAANGAQKVFNAAAGLLETQTSSLTGPIVLASQPELAAALEQAYGLVSGRTARPVVPARRPMIVRPKDKSSRERSR
jgi:hypothetical protein